MMINQDDPPRKLGLQVKNQQSGNFTVYCQVFIKIFGAIGCGVNQYTVHLGSNSIKCINCTVCAPGFGSVPHCGDFLKEIIKPECTPCQPGVSFSGITGSCELCTDCMENEEIIEKCTVHSDTKCGMCLPG